MQATYNPATIEQQTQQNWDSNHSFRATEDESKEKFYCLAMFPYPSGKLHMGHVRNYTIGDVIARYQRMLGKNVLQPMGWDAFGLPAEGAAIKNNMPPANWTYSNIDYMRNQLRRLGFAYDWSRELATCQPDYYKWEQWLFIELYNKGLVYRKNAVVNWDPVDQTVLANEQVIDGRGWRSGALVERREIPQWFIKITAYADELLAELDNLDGWPDQVRTMQRNWIGRSEGVQLDFTIPDSDAKLTVFTTRPDTLMGVTYVAVAAEHPLALSAAEGNPELTAFIEECRHGGTSEMDTETIEKKGMPLGLSVIHPISEEAIPVYAANFVLMGYGTGAVMAVPAHDQRDWEFATKYGIPIRQVIVSKDGSDCSVAEAAYVETGVLTNSDSFDGLTSEDAFDAIAEYLSKADKGGKQTNYRLRDWGVSRQRYWGAPIPMIHCKKCGIVPVPEDDLPVVLPEDVAFDATGGSPIKKMPEFSRITCPECGAEAERETDTFDTFMESSWYYARFACPDAASEMLDQRANYWLPVDHYVGGIEHAILHLLYARFYHKLMRDVGLVKSDEPFTNLLTQGMVVAETYYREDASGSMQWFNPEDVEIEHDDKGKATKATLQQDGQAVQIGGIEKMSKSKNNGVDPQQLIDLYGADTVRLYTMFTAPPDQSLEWSDDGVEGSHRFLKRVWALAANKTEQLSAGAGDLSNLDDMRQAARREIHQALQQANRDYERQQFNTVVSAGMKIINVLYKLGDTESDRALLHEGMGITLSLLGPIAPHITHYLWQELGYGADILEANWPQPDAAALKQETVQIVIQINGKVRSRIHVAVNADQEAIEQAALEDDNIQRFIGDAQVRKIILVPGKLVNIVAK
ncbi:Leucyl-tRNA synthetase [hydrothermal vent metagenome]|uniref:leucine--tRNA ligase n=1 Tax=hydrothermal vent metagenome TaxID=652676 RepID=A0A3B1ASG3_9ZZZZ